MRERYIPMYLVKFNQVVLVAGTALALLLQQPWMLFGLFALLMIPQIAGPKFNLIFMIGKWVLPKSLAKSTEKEAFELQRFNQIIATALLGIASFLLLVVDHWSGWLFSSMVTVAAGVALAGFCVGCFIYFQWKQWQHKA